MRIKFKKLHSKAIVPTYAHEGDAGLDLHYCGEHTIIIPSFRSAAVPTGIALELPSGVEAQVRPRSGLASKHSITVLNSPGTIDPGYRGEIKVILYNMCDDKHPDRIDFYVEPGMKIAQMVIAPFITAELLEVDDLNSSDRGSNGFGSTGSYSFVPV